MRDIAGIASGVIAIGAVAVGLVAADIRPATAQSWDNGQAAEERAQARRATRGPTRIQVNPNRQLVRLCEDWLAVENRPSGTVIVPQMRCRWGYR
ncbi:hypothetical protein PQJ75_30665 [Rhodoplanes sp. TEM]|uniref:Uncharacterized protein n=1 Tax=Rhodoplanes tepidamans TaxID=200616 RepID=A0ABT5JKH7_RHOTP|nr:MULTISPECIES: hypothetical protein [Rhodoplanes]MDC7790049.1 hypothetical protein [Rhodoplanes tepidamans]MDC7988113.1 hypothetical protein [Rhodoplanes sp. TEM]MDQ0359250.1 hypothetical protein [Rhodoplanes tepidamans]